MLARLGWLAVVKDSRVGDLHVFLGVSCDIGFRVEPSQSDLVSQVDELFVFGSSWGRQLLDLFIDVDSLA